MLIAHPSKILWSGSEYSGNLNGIHPKFSNFNGENELQNLIFRKILLIFLHFWLEQTTSIIFNKITGRMWG